MERQDIVIFGASGGALKVAKTLANLGVDFNYFVDNDSKKWGSIVERKEVKSPESLMEDEAKIIIASDYQQEIEKQLNEMGIMDRLLLKEEIILNQLGLEDIKEKDALKSLKQEKNVIIELADAGICLGGIETWALMVCRALKARGEKVTFVTKEMEQEIPTDMEDYIRIINYDYERYKESIQETIELLVSSLPCTVISNWQSQVMIAAILVKKMYPEQMNIISVVHNDKIVLYRRQSYLEPYTDYIFCVSNKIKRIFEEEFHVLKEKLIYKETPVKYTEFKKQYTLNPEKPLKIGFAARISKFQKRADLLLKVVKELEARKICSVVEIAGNGNYFDKFANEIEGFRNVKLLGCISRDAIADFWKEKDVFLSVSDFEGTSISMLEAMSWGVVPVVTKVSGVDEFVENGMNGYCSEPGDWESVVNNIADIEAHREKLPEYGEICKQYIQERCKEEDYIDVLEKYI